MNIRNRVLSLFILGLLILPVLLSVTRPNKSGNVLGVNEVTQNSLQAQQVQTNTQATLLAQPTKSPEGEIGSGAKEIISLETPDTGKIYKGRAVWDKNAKSPAATDKLNLGTSFKISSKNETLDLVVGNVRVLSPDTLVVLDENTFVKLGGDLEKNQYIDVTIVLD